MKSSHIVSRCGRLSMAFLMLLTIQVRPAWAAKTSSLDEAGLLPIETSNVNKNLMDELFGPKVGNGTTPVPTTNPLTPSTGGLGPVLGGRPAPTATPTTGTKTQTITQSKVGDEFRCNLFESVPYSEILSAVNALNAAVSSPACAGDSAINVKSIVENNKAILDTVEELRGYVEHQETIQEPKVAEISNKVDVAIRAATSIANSFAQTDLLRKECREAMSSGEIAVSIGEIINGLTPYALMATSLMTGGTAAIPYIVGGSVITGAVSSMTKIIAENGVKVEQADVRRAIVENTCQYIRLDQKYKFLIRSRQEQISKISKDLTASQRLFSAKLGSLPGGTSELVERKNILSSSATSINHTLTSFRGQLELDKQFMKSTSDEIKICQLGIQLSILSKDPSSYVSRMLSTLDQALIAYGTTNVAQAQALKMSSNLAIRNLEYVGANQFSGEVNFQQCANSTKSFIETIDQSGTLAKQLVKLSQDSIERGLQDSKEYSQYKARLSTLNQKQYQAERITQSLDKLQAYANTITQSEIDSEMHKLRNGLFNNSFMGLSSSPVLKWFEYVNGLERAEVTRFNNGLNSLRSRAYRMTPSGERLLTTAYGSYRQTDPKQAQIDYKNAQNLVPFNLKQVALGSKDHDNVCRELQDVWTHWAAALDHLAAADAFCNMIEPYVYDNRPEDRSLVLMCRGIGTAIPSTISKMKNDLVKNYTRDWALLIESRISALACSDLGGE